jgi:hypothetical protein
MFDFSRDELMKMSGTMSYGFDFRTIQPRGLLPLAHDLLVAQLHAT